MYNIVILFTVDQIFAYILKVSKNVNSFLSTSRKVTRAVINLVESFTPMALTSLIWSDVLTPRLC